MVLQVRLRPAFSGTPVSGAPSSTRGRWGGTCALRGCQPKKVFLVNTHLAAETRALVGSGFSEPAVTDWRALQQLKRAFTDPVPESTKTSLESRGIDVFVERAVFVEPGVIELGDSGRKLRAERFLIATGARSRELPVPGAELAATSDDFLDLDELPESMVFIGGGYISMEFAFIAALSGSRVTILQRGPRLLPQFPQSLLEPVVAAGREHGITFVTDATVTGIAKTGAGFSVSTAEQGAFPAAWVMGAIGRAPNVEDMGLEIIGVTSSARGIEINEHMETTAAGVFAAGDCVAVYYETVTDNATGQFLGAHITGPYAGEQINIFTAAIRSGMTARVSGRCRGRIPRTRQT